MNGNKKKRIFNISVVMIVLVALLFLILNKNVIIETTSIYYFQFFHNPFIAGKCEYGISFTSVPSRLYIIPFIIRRLNQLPENIRPRQVILTLSEKYKRFPHQEIAKKEIEYLKSFGINIYIRNDHGPINKLVGALQSNLISTLIVDDERYLEDGVFVSSCVQSKYNLHLFNRNISTSEMPILSFFKSNDHIHLSGSYGYLIPKDEMMLEEMLNIDKMKSSIFGLYEDDLWISCIAIQKFFHSVNRLHFDAQSLFISQISSSRNVGLIEQFGSDEDNQEWNIRYQAFLRGLCYEPPLKHSKRP